MLNHINVMTVAELLEKSFPATDSMLAGNMFDKGGALLISGPQKIGKSLFATQLALSLASRERFLGLDVGQAEYRTLILQAEVSEKRMQERFARQVTAFPKEASTRVLNACVYSSIKIDDEAGAATVRAWAEEHRPDLLIVDPLTNFHTGDENTAQDMSRVMTVLDEFRKNGIAVALVHHHGKSSSARTNVGHKARGSTALPAWYDSHLSMEWAEPLRTVRLRFELRNDETPEDVVLRLNRESLLFEVQTDEQAQISLLVSVIRELGSADADAVGQRCAKTRQWASQWLNRAVDEGRMVRSQGRPVLYSLPGQQPGTSINVTSDGVVVTTNTTESVPVWVDGEEVRPFNLVQRG